MGEKGSYPYYLDYVYRFDLCFVSCIGRVCGAYQLAGYTDEHVFPVILVVGEGESVFLFVTRFRFKERILGRLCEVA